jgi:DNA-binding transcriptional regulator YiaG
MTMTLNIPTWQIRGKSPAESTFYGCRVELPIEKDLPGISLDDFVREAIASDKDDLIPIARKELAESERMIGDGSSIRTIRLSLGLSQSDLAGKLGTSQSYVARLETGVVKAPSIRRVRQLATVLECSNDKILSTFDD